MYKKADLLSTSPYLLCSFEMCTFAADDISTPWPLMVELWEAFQSHQRTAVVLDHFDHELNVVLVGVQTEDGQHRNVQLEVMLLAGSDLIRTLPFFPRCCYPNVYPSARPCSWTLWLFHYRAYWYGCRPSNR
ncbi:hypothetical protein DFJ43DRAFT_50281 [Lentinula guzmanii]|uniref:Uncharacterized protein n=1 Tax=Lentinula guzmanii TaxID=2804957 RepID=A0AA38J910_9AGAR|nr:hypothetical protein DFJ43DRAFT_50281 [Lentinula guzmanii]